MLSGGHRQVMHLTMNGMSILAVLLQLAVELGVRRSSEEEPILGPERRCAGKGEAAQHCQSHYEVFHHGSLLFEQKKQVV
jgi:hypothetical protein